MQSIRAQVTGPDEPHAMLFSKAKDREEWEFRREKYLRSTEKWRERILGRVYENIAREQADSMTIPGKTIDCPVCRKLVALARYPSGKRRNVPLGSWDAIRSMPCRAHNRLIIDLLKHSKYPDIQNCPIKQLVAFKAVDSPAIHMTGSTSDDVGPASAWGIHLLADPSADPRVTAREVHDRMVPINLLCQWKDHCDRYHGPKCRTRSSQASCIGVRPQWLIDTQTYSLVPGTQSDNYVALSYVWGNSAITTTNQANLLKHQTPGAFSQVTLPKTIRDALELTQKLAERYCWIDSLCIVQDDRKAKYSEIENMAAIFANASFTIIAEGGSNAHSGLPGISSPRNVHQAIFELDGGFKLMAQGRPEAQKSTWATRAWTFQEKLFSQRSIVLDKETVRWECQEERWVEDLCQPMRSTPMQRKSMFSARLPNYTSLLHLLQNYNQRSLTYEEDALDAFTGVMRSFRAFKHGFLSGLPLSFFEMAILWEPGGRAVRRVAANDTACLPSWSWAGWKCSISAQSWDACIDYKKATFGRYLSASESITPLVQWSYHQELTGTPVPIATEWYEYRKEYLDADRTPPVGWTRHEIHEGSWELSEWPDCHKDPGKVPRCFYKHESDPTAEFWYPIPQPAASEVLHPIKARFISCRTRRCWLLGGEYIKPFHLSLTTADGTVIGYVVVFDQLDPDQNKDQPLSSPLEIVELARGHRNGPLLHEHKEPRFRLVDYYHVMWIEWEGDIAYRRGLGRVSVEALDAQTLESFDLTLG